MTEKFWYVYKRWGGAPSYKHASYDEAVREAERLVVIAHDPAPVYILLGVVVGLAVAAVGHAQMVFGPERIPLRDIGDRLAESQHAEDLGLQLRLAQPEQILIGTSTIAATFFGLIRSSARRS